MGLDGLATEIVHQITSLLKPSDIASVRAVCRRLAELCTPEFPELTVYHSRESLTSAVKLVTGNNKIAATVKTVRYQADRFGRLLSYERWNFSRRSAGGCIRAPSFDDKKTFSTYQGSSGSSGLFERRPDNGDALRELGGVIDPPGQEYSLQQLQHAYETYRSLCNDQDDMENSNFVAQELSRILSACTACEGMIVSVDESKSDEHILKQSSKSSKSCTAFQPSLVYPAGDPEHRARNVYAVTNALLALDASDRSIKSFTAPGTSHNLFYQSTEATVQTFNTVATHFTRLVIDIDLLKDAEIYTVVAQAGKGEKTTSRFHAFLASASNMREVALGVYRLHPRDPLGPLDFDRILEPITWPNLTVLWLSDFHASPKALVHFLQRHGSTLRSLKLNRMRLTSGTWLEFFSAARDGLCRLEKLRLRGELVDSSSTKLVMSEYWSPARPSVVAEAFEDCCLRGEDVYELDVDALLKEHRRKIVDHGYDSEWVDPQGGDFED